MKISSVRAVTVQVPITRMAVFSKRKMTHMLSTIVEVETDAGILGLGEVRGVWPAQIINKKFAPLIVGLPIHDHNKLREICCAKKPFDYGFPEYLMENYAFSGIEIALWDILGKETEQPLYRLLGGAVRDRALFVGYAYTVDPDEGLSNNEIAETMARIASKSIEETGASMFEFKIGLHSVSCEIEVVKQIRGALGTEIELAVDANMGFTVEQARRFLTETKDYRLANIEEPIAGLRAIDRLRKETGVPVSTHCVDLDALACHPMIDSVVSDPSLLGGINDLVEFISSVKALNKRFWLRSHWELGIGWAALYHIGISRPEIDRPSQALINWVEDDLILGDPWLVREGGVQPPEKPGLGVELDRKALEKYKLTSIGSIKRI